MSSDRNRLQALVDALLESDMRWRFFSVSNHLISSASSALTTGVNLTDPQPRWTTSSDSSRKVKRKRDALNPPMKCRSPKMGDSGPIAGRMSVQPPNHSMTFTTVTKWGPALGLETEITRPLPRNRRTCVVSESVHPLHAWQVEGRSGGGHGQARAGAKPGRFAASALHTAGCRSLSGLKWNWRKGNPGTGGNTETGNEIPR